MPSRTRVINKLSLSNSAARLTYKSSTMFLISPPISIIFHDTKLIICSTFSLSLSIYKFSDVHSSVVVSHTTLTMGLSKLKFSNVKSTGRETI